MSLERFTANAVVCEEDEVGDSMFIVLSGVCEVRAQAPPEKQLLDDETTTLQPQGGSGKDIRRIRVTSDEPVFPILRSQCVV